MNKRRITIEIEEGISDKTAIERLLVVIQGGRVSIGAKGKEHYCWVTTWEDGIRVYSKEKYKTDNDRFLIYKTT